MPRFRVLVLGDEQPPPPEWLVEDIVPVGVSMLYGESGCGKTFVAVSIAVAVASGVPWLDHGVRRGTVLYVAAEGGAGILRRLEAAKGNRPCDQVPILVVPEAVLLGTTGSDADVEALSDQVVEKVQCRNLLPVVLIVLDTLARTFAGNENLAEDVTAFQRHVDMLRERVGRDGPRVSVLVVHHSGRDKTRERGSSALRAATDAVLRLEKKEGKKKAAGRKLVALVCDRQRDADDFAPLALALQTVEAMDHEGKPMLDGRGLPVTTCTLERAAPSAVSEVVTDERAEDPVLRFIRDHPGLTIRGITQGLRDDGVRIGRKTVTERVREARQRGLIAVAGTGWTAVDPSW